LIKDSRDGEIFMKTNLPYFEKHFTKDQLYLLIECSYFNENFSIFKSMNYLSKIDERINSALLSIKFSNRLPTAICACYYSIYCYVNSGGRSCNDGGCTSGSGCGITGTSNCTGMCN
jgi:hypothetical protein